MKKYVRNFDPSQILIATVLLLFTLTILIPILNLLAQSLTDPLRAHEISGMDVIPKGFSFINYEILFGNPMVMRSILNSIWITVAGTLLNLVLTSMAAYVLARTHFPGKGAVVVFLIALMVFEPGLIPQYLLVRDLQLLNTYTILIISNAVNIYYLFILMRFFQDIPEEILEASRLDGAGHFRIYTRIILPLSKPALATMCLFYGVYHWNEYFKATIYITDPDKWPLQVVLRQFVVRKDNTSILGFHNMLSYEQVAALDFSSLQASTIIIAMIPLLLVYPFILKYFTNGTFEGGVKD